MGVRVFLNGKEQEVLNNGKTIVMQTHRSVNILAVSYSADDTTKTIKFEATPGGNVRITLKYTGAKLIIEE